MAGAVKGLLQPDGAVQSDPIYGYSSRSQFHFSIDAGYFLWATGTSVLYKGSGVAIAQNAVQVDDA